MMYRPIFAKLLAKINRIGFFFFFYIHPNTPGPPPPPPPRRRTRLRDAVARQGATNVWKPKSKKEFHVAETATFRRKPLPFAYPVSNSGLYK